MLFVPVNICHAPVRFGPDAYILRQFVWGRYIQMDPDWIAILLIKNPQMISQFFLSVLNSQLLWEL